MTKEYNEKRKTISISGAQEKYSLILNKNELSLTDVRGSHILKPVPAERLERIEDMPANEHVTMQIANQLYGIKTAACGMIFFDDGNPAYITRQFDYKTDGTKYQLEDFATLMGKSPEREGTDFKYNASYLDIANLIRKYVPAAGVEMINFFRIVVFNYLFANGDAHLKNFTLMESEQGDYLLSPAYDLLCTTLHIDDADLGLHGGLYEGDMIEAPYLNYGFYTYQSFILFAEKIGVRQQLAESIIDQYTKAVLPATEMIRRSFLRTEAKEKYIEILWERHWRFKLR
ncbi:HipA domain-containing protein [Terrimonas ferruginea]|uniref:HipA domain-containing protein n=1 Tax=Terrimonas ferruginea TaxID=249 RepID=UPI00042A90BB|nr:HipA domain-containing protein [Terrimonas ferruginea]